MAVGKYNWVGVASSGCAVGKLNGVLDGYRVKVTSVGKAVTVGYGVGVVLVRPGPTKSSTPPQQYKDSANKITATRTV